MSASWKRQAAKVDRDSQRVASNEGTMETEAVGLNRHFGYSPEVALPRAWQEVVRTGIPRDWLVLGTEGARCAAEVPPRGLGAEREPARVANPVALRLA